VVKSRFRIPEQFKNTILSQSPPDKFEEVNMPILLVTYDSNKPGQDCGKILEFIKSSGTWAKLSETSYAINTEETPDMVYKQLTPFLSDSSKLFVVNLTRPYAGIKGTGIAAWLEKSLPTS
jgi:hypothetical protein